MRVPATSSYQPAPQTPNPAYSQAIQSERDMTAELSSMMSASWNAGAAAVQTQSETSTPGFSPPNFAPPTIQIYAGKLFDPYNAQASPQPAHLRVDDVWTRHGFFLHPYSETSWEDQVTRESLAERTVRATAHARKTLMAGFTAVRDLGTEGAEDADMALRKCLSGPNPIIPGPRYFVSNRAIVTTGSYGPKNGRYPNRDGVEGIMGAEVADGVEECIKAVRRQVGAGADWIKLYADYRARANMAAVAPAVAGESVDTFTDEEITAMVTTAHKLGVKVAAHCSGPRSSSLLRGRVDTVEHAYEFLADPRVSVEQIFDGSRSSTFWVPTLAAHLTIGRNSRSWDQAQRTFRQVIKDYPNGDVRIACGGDTGVFAHGDNALELKTMVRLGAHWSHVLRWATLGGWECIRSLRWEGHEGRQRLQKVEQLQEDARFVGDNEVPFGAIRKGFAADIIATSGDVASAFEHAVDKGSIVFVMKGGRVFKRNGRESAQDHGAH
ncbi:hypothetical protein EIP91_006283 [Steccherinum ochraceum]|uniref:Amidohydrolase-related domain-containing protein n=1 Tax=Steccherinum ochraceum TaxID=92696 RepID=A0A4V6N728_9APHY|nr:hypothetical protein EIP91_006283 [Steccherinum ochraceum]